jgi:hypothetical protein
MLVKPRHLSAGHRICTDAVHVLCCALPAWCCHARHRIRVWLEVSAHIRIHSMAILWHLILSNTYLVLSNWVEVSTHVHQLSSANHSISWRSKHICGGVCCMVLRYAGCRPWHLTCCVWRMLYKGTWYLVWPQLYKGTWYLVWPQLYKGTWYLVWPQLAV